MNPLKNARLAGLTRRLVPNAGTLVILGLFLLAQSAGARPAPAPLAQSATTLLSYQGTLTGANGAPVNGDVEMVFALYHEAEGGTPFWTEAYTGAQAVEVVNGQFHVLMGSQVALNLSDLTGDLYLGITVNGEEMLPREVLSSVARAVQAHGIAADLDMRGYNINNVNRLVTSGGAEIGLQGNGGGRLVIANNHNDNKIYLEAYSADGLSSASELLLTGIGANSVPLISLLAYETNVYGALDMNGHDINQAGGIFAQNVYAGNVRGNGTQQIHMPGGGNANIYFNWHHGDSVHFGGGDEVADVSIGPTGIDLHGHSIINCGALTEANLQTPEELAAERIDRFEAGDVLCWSAESERLEKCATPNDPLVQAVADANGRPIVIGAEVVKVLGPVRAGDLLVASDTPGYAMVNNDPRPGTVIAQALEDFDPSADSGQGGEQGAIKAMIRKF